MDKRGLSDIVTNVLIILLVLVAVGVIWVFLQPLIFNGAGQLQGSADCITLQLAPTSCVIDNTAGTVIVKAKRNTGEGDLVDMRFVFTDENGETQTVLASNDSDSSNFEALNEFETQTFSYSISGNSLDFGGTGYNVGISAIVGGAEGEPRSCAQLSPVKECSFV